MLKNLPPRMMSRLRSAKIWHEKRESMDWHFEDDRGGPLCRRSKHPYWWHGNGMPIGYSLKSTQNVKYVTCAQCLELLKKEFRNDPKAAVEAAGLLKDKPAEPVKPVSQIVVKTSEFERRIFHLPESRFKAEQFIKGATLTIKAGVNGKSRSARIVMSCSTSGEAFGCSKRQVAVLVE